MKQTIILLLFCILSLHVSAQVPQGISYQAIAFDTGGAAVTNGNVGIRVSILDGSATGTAVYTETHSKTTNAQGLFNLNIGQGTPVTGTFSTISWGSNSKFLKVEVDPTGGSDYTSVGINQLMSVPYALFAETSNSSLDNGGGNDMESDGNFMVFEYDEAKAFSTATNTWVATTTASGNGIDGSVASEGNFMIYEYDEAIAFNGNTGEWSAITTASGNGIDGNNSSNGNFLIHEYNQAIAYSANTGTWTSITTASGNAIDGIVASNGNFLIHEYDQAIVFNASTGTWTSTTTASGNAIDGIAASKGNFLIHEYDEAIIFNADTGTWSSTTTASGNGIDGVLGAE